MARCSSSYQVNRRGSSRFSQRRPQVVHRPSPREVDLVVGGGDHQRVDRGEPHRRALVGELPQQPHEHGRVLRVEPDRRVVEQVDGVLGAASLGPGELGAPLPRTACGPAGRAARTRARPGSTRAAPPRAAGARPARDEPRRRTSTTARRRSAPSNGPRARPAGTGGPRTPGTAAPGRAGGRARPPARRCRGRPRTALRWRSARSWWPTARAPRRRGWTRAAPAARPTGLRRSPGWSGRPGRRPDPRGSAE
jgi:hypothetical protein